MITRIADIDLTAAPYGVPIDTLDYGSPSGSRTVTLSVEVQGDSQDETSAAISRLLSRLPWGAEPVPLIVEASGATQPTQLLARSVVADAFSLPYSVEHMVGYLATLTFSLNVDDFATPANRIFLASPIGDEFPDSDDVVAGDAQFVYAEAGRYCISTQSGRTTDRLYLYGECTAGEWLIGEFEYEITEVSATYGLYIYTRFKTAAGAYATSEIKNHVYAGASVAKGRRIFAIRVPTGAVTFETTAMFNTPTGDCKAYLWNVHIGEKTLAHPQVSPSQDGLMKWEAYTWPENEYTRETVAGVTYNYTGRALTMTAASCATSCFLCAADRQPVKPKRTYGIYSLTQLTARTSGDIVRWRVHWYDEEGTYLSSTSGSAVTATDASAVATYAQVTAPAGAHYAWPVTGISSAGTLTFVISGLDFGEHIMEAPGQMRLSRIGGEAPAKLHIISDTDIEVDATSLLYATAPDDGQTYVFEAEALTTTKGGATIWGTSESGAGSYRGGYSRRDASAAWRTGYADVSRLRPGEYDVWAVCWLSGSGIGYAALAELGTGYAKTVTNTQPELDYVGTVRIPAAKSVPGTADYLGLMMKSPSGRNIYCDYMVLVPTGAVEYKNSPASAGASSFEVDPDGCCYVDGAVSAYVTPAQLRATGRDVLHVAGKGVYTTVEPTHLMRHEIYALEQYALWKG